MIFRKISSAGCPSRSYIAIKNAGSMTAIIKRTADELPINPLARKNVGTPIIAAEPKQTSCRFVNPDATFVFTLVKSRGTGTYGIVTYLLKLHIFQHMSDDIHRPSIADSLITLRVTDVDHFAGVVNSESGVVVGQGLATLGFYRGEFADSVVAVGQIHFIQTRLCPTPSAMCLSDTVLP